MALQKPHPNKETAPMPASTDSTVIPAPHDLEPEYWVHGVTGALVAVRVIAFRVTAAAVEAITWPAIGGEGWEKVAGEGSGYFTAHGRRGLNIQDLATAVRVKRPS